MSKQEQLDNFESQLLEKLEVYSAKKDETLLQVNASLLYEGEKYLFIANVDEAEKDWYLTFDDNYLKDVIQHFVESEMKEKGMMIQLLVHSVETKIVRKAVELSIKKGIL